MGGPDGGASTTTAVDGVAGRGHLPRPGARAGGGRPLRMSTVDTYARDLHEFARLAGGESVLDDIEGTDVDAVVVAYGRQSTAVHAVSRRGEGGARRSVLPRPGSGSRCPDFSPTRRSKVGCARIRWTPRRFGRVSAVRNCVRRAGPALPHARALLDMRPARKPPRRPAVGVAATSGWEPETRRSCGCLRRSVLASQSSARPTGRLHAGRRATYWEIVGKGGKFRRVPVPAAILALMDVYQRDGRPQAAGDDAERALFLTSRAAASCRVTCKIW